MPDHGAEPHPACPSSPPERAQPNLASPRPQLGGAPPNSSRSRSVASNPPARRFTGMGMIWQVKGGIVWRQIFLFLRVRVCVRETPTLSQSEKPESDDELRWNLHRSTCTGMITAGTCAGVQFLRCVFDGRIALDGTRGKGVVGERWPRRLMHTCGRIQSCVSVSGEKKGVIEQGRTKRPCWFSRRSWCQLSFNVHRE